MMSPSAAKETVAVYLRYYLSPSETFVHRQLQGVSEDFAPLVFTSQVRNRDRFPWDDLHVRGKNLAEKIITRAQRNLTGKYSLISARQRNEWRELLRRREVRLIHAHFGHFALDVLPLARELSIPLLVTFHGYDASIPLSNRTYVRNLQDLAAYAHVITVSHNMAERLAAAGVKPRRHDVHYIGVPLEDFVMPQRVSPRERLSSGESLRLLQVSNFVEVKGHRYTIDAFARYREGHPGATLTLAGDGPLRGDMEAHCARLGLGESVRFTGVVDKAGVIGLMHSHDVFVQHSVTLSNGCMEGLPTVLMEAMATGMTVVASRHSGIPELVVDAETGFLVPERDIDRYVTVLDGLADADGDVGARARERVERDFNMAIQNRKLVEIYRSAMFR